MGDWPAFADSAEALAQLTERFKLGVITNCDDDLFAASAGGSAWTFDWVITAQQAGSYKPSHAQLRARASSAWACRASASCTSRRASSTTT